MYRAMLPGLRERRLPGRVCGCQYNGHSGVQVCTGMEGEVHGGEHCQTPSEGDNTPACVLSVGLLEGHCGTYAGTEQNHDEGAEELGSEDSEGGGAPDASTSADEPAASTVPAEARRDIDAP